jgi:hypothetical protein
MRRTDAVCSQYRRRNGVAFRFHVSANKVEPAVSNCRCNLLAKDCSRATLADEAIPLRPEVTSIIKPSPFARRAETGAGAGTCPDRSVVGPSGESERVAPDANSGEEMALGISQKVCWLDILDAPFIHVSGRY